MDQVEEIKRKVNIVSVVGEYVTLKNTGRNHKGLCPFHGEKTPSFMVNEELQIYKCFGCGKGGDVIKFLMEIEGLEFVEALEKLAKRAGVELKKLRVDSRGGEKRRMLEIHSLASEYYHYLLTEHKVGEVARKYLLDRGLNEKIWKTFKLGFSLSTWDGLSKFLILKKGFKEGELVSAGLSIKGNRGGVYDRFRGRVMFPLLDSGGKVVGFSGRVIPELARKDEPKYINSPETLIYHKSQMLFGLSQARQAIREKGRVVVVEGELDMISSYVSGVTETVAIKGSALTEEMVERLARLCNLVILALDADEAGEEALRRSVETLEKRGLEVKVVYWSDGKDPDELARKNPSSWRKLVDKPVSVYEWIMKKAFDKWGMETPEDIKRVVKMTVPYLSKIENRVVAEVWVKRLAKKLDVSKERVWEEMEKVGMDSRLRGNDGILNQVQNDEKISRGDKLTERLLTVLFQLEGGEKSLVKKILSGVSLDGAGGKLLVKWIESVDGKVASFIKKLPDELKSVAEKCFINEKEDSLGEKEVVRLTMDLVRDRLHIERVDLISKLEVVEELDDEEKIEEISKRLVWLDKKERGLNY
ncbi:DNA primase [Patescibacteria group bacterium]|nr:DNA primase [Patescibacteria group bacterium]